MEPRFEVQTVYRKEFIEKQCRFYSKHRNYRINRLIYLISALIWLYPVCRLFDPLVIRTLFSDLFFEFLPENPLGVLFLLISPVFFIYFAVRFIFMVRQHSNRLWKNKKQFEGQTTVTTFFEDHIVDVSHNNTLTLPYSEVASVEESDEVFCLITTNNLAITVAKSDFTIGAPDDFRAFIQEKTGKKIKIIR